MKKLVIFCLSIMAFPLSAKTKAYSPNIPGQPLIFHTSKPSISPIEKKILDQLSCSQLQALFGLANSSIRLSEGLLGLVGTLYLPIEKNQKLSVSKLYNEDIEASILQIDRLFFSLGGSSSKKLAQLMNQTLTSFAQIANQMIHDTVGISTNKLFHKDYLQMQSEVINHFVAELEKFNFSASALPLKARSENALEGMVSCFSLFISDTDSLVSRDNAGPKSMVLARQQFISNLTVFVEATFALQAITLQKRCLCHGK